MNRFDPEVYKAGKPATAFMFIAPPVGGFLILSFVSLIATTTYDAAMMQTRYATEAAWANVMSPLPHGPGVL